MLFYAPICWVWWWKKGRIAWSKAWLLWASCIWSELLWRDTQIQIYSL